MGSTFARSKSEEKSKKKRLKTLAFQEEASGAHFSWSGVALGRPKGGPRGYGCHRGAPSPLRSGGVGPPYKSTTWGLRGSEAKKRSYSGSDTPQGRRIAILTEGIAIAIILLCLI